MSELYYYRRLLNQLQLIVGKLNSAITSFQTLNSNLQDGLTINETNYKGSIISQGLTRTINERDRINNTIIPAVRSKIYQLEAEEARLTQ